MPVEPSADRGKIARQQGYAKKRECFRLPTKRRGFLPLSSREEHRGAKTIQRGCLVSARRQPYQHHRHERRCCMSPRATQIAAVVLRKEKGEGDRVFHGNNCVWVEASSRSEGGYIRETAGACACLHRFPRLSHFA